MSGRAAGAGRQSLELRHTKQRPPDWAAFFAHVAEREGQSGTACEAQLRGADERPRRWRGPAIARTKPYQTRLPDWAASFGPVAEREGQSGTACEAQLRSEEHTSEIQSLKSSSYDVIRLKQK